MMKNAVLDQAHVYTDLVGLQRLKSSQLEKGEALAAVAKQFESLMINSVLRSMRQANSVFSEGNPLTDKSTEFYQEMYDHQLSLSMTRHKGFGLADMLTRQLADGEPAGQTGKKTIADYSRNTAPMKSQETRQLHGQTEISDLQTISGSAFVSLQEQDVLESVAFYAEQMNTEVPTEITHTKNTHTPPENTHTLPENAHTIENMQTTQAPSMLTEADISSESEKARISPTQFESPEQFVNVLYPFAEQAAADLGVDPRVLLAQSALETGWGSAMIKHEDGRTSFNLFGIKADQRWQGEVAWTTTTEYREGIPVKEKASFRSYDSYLDSFQDYLHFLRSHPRYQNALQQVERPEQFAHELQRAGYATDPQYGVKIARIMNGDTLQAAHQKALTTVADDVIKSASSGGEG